jgi:phage terminase large subunit GpA-like protein
MSDHYMLALADACAGYEALRPPNRVSVSQGAADTLVIKQPGTAGGSWSPDETPYMVGPMDALSSREHEAVVFVGPARCGKTASLLLGWAAHNIVNDPGDMLFLQMSKDKAREFSKTDVDRALRNSPKVHAMKSTRAVDSNTFDTMFRHGMFLRIAWPTITNVSGSTYRYVAITDIERMENAENVDGEGNLFDLAKKRTTTFLSRGMTLVESSPGKPLEDPAWKPVTPHEAPPTKGIMSLYNRSDRHRWYWRCPDCADHFEAAPGLKLFSLLPPDEVLLEEVRTMNIMKVANEYAKVVCPHCGSVLDPKLKQHLNRPEHGAIWVPDGVRVNKDGSFTGDALQSKIRGYWLGGVAAAYQSWASLVANHLTGLQEYALTGSEEKLKQTVNTDQGAPYMSMHLRMSQAGSNRPEDRAEKSMQRYVVPEETRCLIAAVDVQGGVNSRFVVQVTAIGPHRERWLVDRFEIKDSEREGMGSEFAQIDPAGHPEDWDVLTKKLVNATWRTPNTGREIRPRTVIVDSGGEDGVTVNAYAWKRRLRRLNLFKRVILYKGASTKGAPIIKETMVGKSSTHDTADIPLLHCNPNLLSDIVQAGLTRQTPGPGYWHFPAAKHPTQNPDGWLSPAFFSEMDAEVRNADGTWTQVRKRNEAFDLCRMTVAAELYLRLDKVADWSKVPPWLAPLDQNSEVITVEDRREMRENEAVLPVEPRPVQVVQPRIRRQRRHTQAQL